MATYTQTHRQISVDTPLGKDVLLLQGFTGREGVAQLFSFQLDLLAENTTNVAFDKILGQKVTVNVSLADGSQRHVNGICSRISQGVQDKTFTAYRAEIVPQFWLLTRKKQSRIFQHLSVPDILKKVLEGVDVKYEIQGTFHPRDFCVQYRETDFNFASRLMEEEGIYYFFKHTAGGHQMVVANTPQSHPDMPTDNTIIFEAGEGGTRPEDRINRWEKIQELRSGKCTLWDHCFELPGKHLDADHAILDSVAVGKVTHKLKVGGNDRLEIYDYPGEYAQRFDGVDHGGGNRPGDLQNIFDDNKRTVEIRMQQEAVNSLVIQGAGNCRYFVSGHKFQLERHFNADGQYVLTSVEHTARLAGDYRSGESGELEYNNTFACIPFQIPYRPQRITPKPVVQGTQTAVVVGPAGEEIFTDKYGRVKVQFNWDRQGKNDADSSCWVRVAQNWAGKRWGAMFIPRIGQEVIVDFVEGDANDPIIIGRVYNAENMPPYALPGEKTKSTIMSNCSKGGGGSNEMRFEDAKGSEEIFLHGQKDWTIAIENDKNQTVGHDETMAVTNNRTKTVGVDQSESIGANKTIKVGANHTETIGGNMTMTVAGNETETVQMASAETIALAKALTIGAAYQVSVGAAMNETVAGAKAEEIGGAKMVVVGALSSEKVGANKSVDAGSSITEKAAKDVGITAGNNVTVSAGKNLVLNAGDQITIQTGSASITMKSNGDISINGNNIQIKGSGTITLKAQKIVEN